MSPRLVTEFYSRIVDNFVDNAVSATNLANDLTMVNLENVQNLTATNREYWSGERKNTKQVFSRTTIGPCLSLREKVETLNCYILLDILIIHPRKVRLTWGIGFLTFPVSLISSHA
jgi:hypothetical protein